MPQPRQTSAVAPIAVEYWLAEQFVHATLPFATLYVPAAHKLQANPSDPVDPALHLQSVKKALLKPELVLDGHERHVVLEMAATVVE